ncbi:unnamed protein product [Durusdinium trenchii]|uniref:Uncharacterized protein n=1 Tax=Durusdinium trenchii TaxID=1381693 RepID=A0ABP0JSJ8_9DINO
MNGEGVPSARKSEVTFLEDGLKHAHQMNRLLNVNLTDRDQICEMAVEIIKELSEVPEIPEEIRKGLKALQAKLAPIDVLQPALGAGTQQWEAGYSEEHVEQVQSDRNWYYQKLMEVIFRCQGQGGSRWKSESKSSMDCQ